MPPIATPPLPGAPVWREFGRPTSGEAQDWTTWVSLLGDGGDALYRSLVIGDGAIAVTVDLHSPGRSGLRTIHRGRCGLPPTRTKPPSASACSWERPTRRWRRRWRPSGAAEA